MKALWLLPVFCFWSATIAQVKIYDQIGFPYGITKDSVFDGDDFEADCADQTEDDIAISHWLCWSKSESTTYNLEIGNFESNSAFFNLLADSANGEYFIYEITVSSNKYDECNDMARSRLSLIAAISAKYSKGAQIEKGKKFSSDKCKDYMEEGLTFYKITKGNWEVKVDSYWYDGGYRVFAQYRYLPRYLKYLKRVNAHQREKTGNALRKL